jgi:chromosome segregation ATPase
MEMTGQQMVDAFMAKEDLGATEQVLKNKVISINEALLAAEKEFRELNDETLRKQAECERLKQQMGALLGLIVDVEVELNKV